MWLHIVSKRSRYIWRIEDQAGNAAVLLNVGFLPGMRVAAVTMSQSKKGDPYVDEFVTIIKLHVLLLRLQLCYSHTLELTWILFQRSLVPLWRIEDQAGNAAVLLNVGFLPGMKVAAVTMSQSKKVPLWRIEDQAGNAAVLLNVGFLPGMKVAAVTMSQSKKVPLWRIEDQAGNAAVLLNVGFLPGMKVAAVTMSQSKKVPLWRIEDQAGNAAVLLNVGFLPGMKVAAVTMSQSKKVPLWRIEDQAGNAAVLLNVGFLPGMKVAAVTMSQSKKVPLWRIEDQAGNAAVLLNVGFLPGMKVAAVTMSQSKKGDPYVDEFVTIIKLHVLLLRLPLCYSQFRYIWRIDNQAGNAVVLLTLGFLPGMKVAAVTMSQSKKVEWAYLKFSGSCFYILRLFP
ncbi:hypothetical protein ACET3Z_017154 [Daucus carota]